MNLFLITRNFPPLLGGMERLNYHLAKEMAKYGRVQVVAPQGAAAYQPEGVEVIEVPGDAAGRFLLGAWWRGWRAARRFRPEVVLAGSGLTAPLAWTAARLVGAKAAVYLHGLDVAIPHPLYRLVWRPFLRRMDRVIVNSGPTAALARNIGISPAQLAVVPPGVTLPVSCLESQRQKAKREFRFRHNLGAGPLLLAVGRLTTRKGLLEFVRDVLPQLVAQVPDIQLAIVGGLPRKALAAQAQTPQQIREAAGAMGVAERLHFLGEITEEELATAYLAADVHVFPVREIPGDPEGFGMVAVEAAAYGLPTVAYASGGVVDAVADGVSGRLVLPGDAVGFAAAVLEMLRRPPDWRGMRAYAERFSWESFGVRLVEVL